MNIAVTGGSGFIGSRLLKKLSENNRIKTLLNKRRLPQELSGNIECIPGTLNDKASLLKLTEGSEMVFHLVGLIVETRTKTFEDVVVNGTKNLIEACQKNGVKKIIYLSALGTEPNAKTKYHRTKYEAEEIIKKSQMEYVILRPSLIYGPNDGFVNMLSDMISRLPFVPIVGSGKYLMQPIYIDDLIEIMSRLTVSLEIKNITINIAGEEKLEYIRIVNLIKRQLNKKRMNLFIPLPLMKIIAGILELFLKPAPVTKDQLIMLESGNFGDISLMKELFPFSITKFEEGLKKYLR